MIEAGNLRAGKFDSRMETRPGPMLSAKEVFQRPPRYSGSGRRFCSLADLGLCALGQVTYPLMVSFLSFMLRQGCDGWMSWCLSLVSGSRTGLHKYGCYYCDCVGC